MIDDFRPHMSEARLDGFGDDLATIRAARDEAAALGVTDPGRYPVVAAFAEQYPAIDEDMSDMLASMRASVGNYEGVAALPPFALFPWFFVAPGVLLAGVAGWTLVADRDRAPARGRSIALVALAVGLVAAPFAFQMFTRAPGGSEMIAEFRPLMTHARVTQMQGYFLVIGGGEAELRNRVVPDLAAAGAEGDAAAIKELSQAWPKLSSGMAPMIGTMADNVEAFASISALPPFWLFPWFFVLPGVLVAGLAVLARRPVRVPRALPAAVRPTDHVLEGA
jgi:hypothetical protein